MYIPDKPGQSHNTQDFESTLSEVRFLFTVPGYWEGWGTLWGKMGSHLWGKIGVTLSEVRFLSTPPGYWEGWVTLSEVRFLSTLPGYWEGRGTLWGKMGSHLWGTIGVTLTGSEVRFLFTVAGCWEGWGTQRDIVKHTYWDGRGGEGVGGGGDCKTYV